MSQKPPITQRNLTQAELEQLVDSRVDSALEGVQEDLRDPEQRAGRNRIRELEAAELQGPYTRTVAFDTQYGHTLIAVLSVDYAGKYRVDVYVNGPATRFRRVVGEPIVARLGPHWRV